MNPEIRYAKAGEVSIAYQLLGEGSGAVVAVPGILSHLETPSSTAEFSRFYRRLPRFTRVAIFDKRGTGLSDRLPLQVQPSMEQRAEDVTSVMNAIGLEKASLLGIADGGPVAVTFAANYPQRIDALMIYGSWARLAHATD
jgi:pimeloyl-ACP methyl ester carboxylesterase